MSHLADSRILFGGSLIDSSGASGSGGKSKVTSEWVNLQSTGLQIRVCSSVSFFFTVLEFSNIHVYLPVPGLVSLNLGAPWKDRLVTQ
jgi:hypothetical protein